MPANIVTICVYTQSRQAITRHNKYCSLFCQENAYHLWLFQISPEVIVSAVCNILENHTPLTNHLIYVNWVTYCIGTQAYMCWMSCLLSSPGAMAVPPSYSDLGKTAKDIFSKGYGELIVKMFAHLNSKAEEEKPWSQKHMTARELAKAVKNRSSYCL